MSKRKSSKKSDEPVGCSAYFLFFAFALFCLNYFWHWISDEWSTKLTIFTVIGVILAVLFLIGESGESEVKENIEPQKAPVKQSSKPKKKPQPKQDENVIRIRSVETNDDR